MFWLPYIVLPWTLGYVYLFRFVFSVFSDVYPGVELLGHMVVLFSFLWETSILFFTVAVPIYIPINRVDGFLFSTPSWAFNICRCFDDGHADPCEYCCFLDAELFYHHKDLSHATPLWSYLPPLTLHHPKYLGSMNLFFISVILTLWECYIHRIKHVIFSTFFFCHAV